MSENEVFQSEENFTADLKTKVTETSEPNGKIKELTKKNQ